MSELGALCTIAGKSDNSEGCRMIIEMKKK